MRKFNEFWDGTDDQSYRADSPRYDSDYYEEQSRKEYYGSKLPRDLLKCIDELFFGRGYTSNCGKYCIAQIGTDGYDIFYNGKPIILISAGLYFPSVYCRDNKFEDMAENVAGYLNYTYKGSANESYKRTNGRKRNLRESEDKEPHRYAIPFSVELHYNYYSDYEIDGLDSDCNSDIYYVINEYVKDAVNSNVELQKINLEVDKDNCDRWDVWFLFTTTSDNLNNTIELLRKTFVGVTEDLLEYEETIQTNYDPGTYYGYGIWGDERWDEETINISVEVEIGDTDGRVDIIDD